MQTRQVVAIVTVIAIIALALGTTIGYRALASGKTRTQTCTTIAVPPPQGFSIKLMNDSGSPIEGLQVTIVSAIAATCNPREIHLNNSYAVTNSSGWIFSQSSIYWNNFVFAYSGETYNFTIPSDPMAWSIATIRVTSGNMTTQICGLGGGSITSSCQSSQTTVVTNFSSQVCTTITYETSTLTPNGTNVYSKTVEGNSTLTLVELPVVSQTTITTTTCR